MSASTYAEAGPEGQDVRHPAGGPSAIRLAVIDTDTGFLRVLTRRWTAWAGSTACSRARCRSTPSWRCASTPSSSTWPCSGPQGWSYLQRCAPRCPAWASSSARGSSTVAQRVRGLRLGADDWLTKPCHPEELIARVEAVVRRRRRAEARPGAAPIMAGEIEIRADRFQAFVGGGSIDLTRREFELIDCSPTPPGRCSSARRSTSASGATRWPTAIARSTSSCASCARSSSAHSPGWKYIHTHFGVGYRFAPEALDDATRRRARGRARRRWSSTSAPADAGAPSRWTRTRPREHRPQRRRSSSRSPRRSPSSRAAGRRRSLFVWLIGIIFWGALGLVPGARCTASTAPTSTAWATACAAVLYVSIAVAVLTVTATRASCGRRRPGCSPGSCSSAARPRRVHGLAPLARVLSVRRAALRARRRSCLGSLCDP